MSNSTEIGQKSLARIVAALVDLGYRVALPFGEGGPYDLVVDDGSRLQRAQCKTGRLRDGVIRFPSSPRAKQWKTQTITYGSYNDDVDLFLVYCPETDGVYWVPAMDVTEGNSRLRVSPPLNNQTANIRWAESYVLLHCDEHA